MSEPTPLYETIRRLKPLLDEAGISTEPEPTVTDLATLPPIESLVTQLRDVGARVHGRGAMLTMDEGGNVVPLDDTTGVTAHLRLREAWLKRRIAWWDVRRERLAPRLALGAAYADCRCFGAGGWGDTRLTTRGDNRMVVLDEQGEAVAGVTTYCTCPDGEALQVANNALRVAWTAKVQREALTSIQAAVLAHSGLPRDYAALTLDGFVARQPETHAARALDLALTVTSWAAAERSSTPEACYPWMVLIGPVGVGKTALATIAARAILERNGTVVFRETTQLLDDIRDTFDRNDGSTSALRKLLVECDLLVLDDLGKEKPTEWVRERLFAIINGRYNDGSKRTIVTSNVPLLPNLADRIGEATIDRILHRARGYELILADWPNLRRVQ